MAGGSDDEFGGMLDETRMVRVLQSQEGVLEGPDAVDPLPLHSRATLTFRGGRRQGEVVTIEKPLTLLGRIEDVVDVLVPDDAASRHHAAISYRDGSFWVYDLGSSNGTQIDGESLQAGELRDGSILRIGQTDLAFGWPGA